MSLGFPSGMAIRLVALDINCGFARTAIRELTPRNRGPKVIDKAKRVSEFKELFASCPTYGLNESYFETDGQNSSLFDRDCEKITTYFSSKWHPRESRVEYEQTFSTTNWKALPQHKQKQHTLANCKPCRDDHFMLQTKFPQGPYFELPLPILTIKKDEMKQLGKSITTRKVFSELNSSFSETFGQNFTDAIANDREVPLQMKPTANERKKKLRSIYRKCRDQENKCRQKTAAIAVLAEDNSMRSYQRKRMLQRFETPPSKRSRTNVTKTHSPDFSKVSWNKQAVLEDLQAQPSAPPAINWQKFAQEHNIPGRNCGQVVKEFAMKSGIDTSRLECGTPHPRIRACKRTLPGSEISSGSDPTPTTIKEEWSKMVASGELSLGVPCIPFRLVKFSTKNGELIRKEIQVEGRKFPLSEVRKKIATKERKVHAIKH